MSEFFEKVVDILRDTPLKDEAQKIVQKCCDLLHKTPNELEPGDGGVLVTQLMTDASNRLSQKEWAELDAKFKILLKRGTAIRKGKVKGVVLSSILHYIYLKKGSVTANGMKQNLRLPDTFRPHSWYPIEVLENILGKIEITMRKKGKGRCRDMGYHITSQADFPGASHWFGNGDGIRNSFSNLRQIFMLDKFKVKEEDGEIVVEFDGTTSINFHHFLMGICDGIFKLKKIPSNSVQEVMGENGVAAIYLGFKNN